MRSDAEPIQIANIVEIVRERLTSQIVDGTLAAGERIVEVQLARNMNISRAPLREACRLLEQQGLLESKPRRGFFVKEFGADAIINLMEYRIALQTEACRLAVSRMQDADLDELRRRFGVLQSEIAADGDVEATLAAALHFHRQIFEMTRNPRLVRAFDDLLPDLRIVSAFLNRFEQTQTGRSNAFYEEQMPPLIAAFEARDGEKAVAEIRSYLELAYFSHLSVQSEMQRIREGRESISPPVGRV